MPVSPLFKVQIEQDIKRCENQKVVNGSEKLYLEVVDRYAKLIKNFMQGLPQNRKVQLYACGPDYRPELLLIASKLRVYLMEQQKGEFDMENNELKNKVDEFIQRGIDIGRLEFHPAMGGSLYSYVSGPLFDTWMGEINIFNERHLKSHPLHDSIFATYFHRKNRPSSFNDMMGHLRALAADTEFFATKDSTSKEKSCSQNIEERATLPMSNRVFIVHGHDNSAKQEVARTLEKAGFEAIILHEQPNKGRTIIEKIEDYADVGYAVILYTECDVGRDKNAPEGSEKYRARQNVVFEHGFFSGRLGRERVFALVKGDVETPGDIGGVIYTTMDAKGAWKMELAKDMQAVGLPADMNKFI